MDTPVAGGTFLGIESPRCDSGKLRERSLRFGLASHSSEARSSAPARNVSARESSSIPTGCFSGALTNAVALATAGRAVRVVRGPRGLLDLQFQAIDSDEDF